MQLLLPPLMVPQLLRLLQSDCRDCDVFLLAFSGGTTPPHRHHKRPPPKGPAFPFPLLQQSLLLHRCPQGLLQHLLLRLLLRLLLVLRLLRLPLTCPAAGAAVAPRLYLQPVICGYNCRRRNWCGRRRTRCYRIASPAKGAFLPPTLLLLLAVLR